MTATWRDVVDPQSDKVTAEFTTPAILVPADRRSPLATKSCARRTALGDLRATLVETLSVANCPRFFLSGEVVLEWPQLSQGL